MPELTPELIRIAELHNLELDYDTIIAYLLRCHDYYWEWHLATS